MTKRPGILWFVLDEASVLRLREAVPPLYDNAWYHHVTLRYGVERDEVASYIGQKQAIEAYAVAYNDGAQACRVKTGGLPDEYGVPHVTLSTASGVKPFASVAMLQGGHEESTLEPPIQITGTTEFIFIDEVKE